MRETPNRLEPGGGDGLLAEGGALEVMGQAYEGREIVWDVNYIPAGIVLFLSRIWVGEIIAV